MERHHAPRTNGETWTYIKDRARHMRAEPTPAEDRMWNAVRARRRGYKFRRQHPIGSYLADLCCPRAGLVIELDGSIHETQQDEDAVRQEFIEGREYLVLRFTNDAVVNRLPEVLKVIDAVLNNGAA
jgi:very-short-patch-repair endonuclease